MGVSCRRSECARAVVNREGMESVFDFAQFGLSRFACPATRSLALGFTTRADRIFALA